MCAVETSRPPKIFRQRFKLHDLIRRGKRSFELLSFFLILSKIYNKNSEDVNIQFRAIPPPHGTLGTVMTKDHLQSQRFTIAATVVWLLAWIWCLMHCHSRNTHTLCNPPIPSQSRSRWPEVFLFQMSMIAPGWDTITADSFSAVNSHI